MGLQVFCSANGLEAFAYISNSSQSRALLHWWQFLLLQHFGSLHTQIPDVNLQSPLFQLPDSLHLLLPYFTIEGMEPDPWAMLSIPFRLGVWCMHSWDWHESVLLHAPMDQSSLIFDYCEGALDLVPLTMMVMKFLTLFFAGNQKGAHVV